MTTGLEGRTTGIGSLPHSTLSEAVDAAFAVDIPFLPQLPGLSADELMVAQALSGDSVAEDAFFERASRVRPPFLKFQIAGPVTLRRYGSPGPDLETVLLSHTLPLIHRAQALGAGALFFVDEPALAHSAGGVPPVDARAWSELESLLQTFKREGARTGIHCCGEGDWIRLLGLPVDVLSFDSALSLQSILSKDSALRAFLNRGSRLAPGIVPTAHSPQDANEIAATFLHACKGLPDDLGRLVSEESIFTPACGLAGGTSASADQMLSTLADVCARIRTARS